MEKNYKNTVCSGGVDLHCHSTISDGKYSVYHVLDMACQKGFSAIAITDHNSIHSEFNEIKEKYRSKGLNLICGSEVTAMYRRSDGKEEELHIVALNFDPQKMNGLFERNHLNRKEYIEALLTRLREENVADIQYEEMINHFESHYLGKMHVAQLLTEKKITSSVPEALELYVGNLGERRCWVPSCEYIDFPDLDSVVNLILSANGIPILAHPFYYKSLTENELERLICHFKKLAGDKAAMEVYYKDYDERQTNRLEYLAQKYSLKASGGSDFHGWSENEKLMQFNPQLLENLL